MAMNARQSNWGGTIDEDDCDTADRPTRSTSPVNR